MPLASIAIEQTAPDRWFAQVQAGGFPGGPLFRLVHLTGESIDDIMRKVAETHASLMPKPAAPTPAEPGPRYVDDCTQPTHIHNAAMWGESVLDAKAEKRECDRLRKLASSLGVHVEASWGSRRMQDEITGARARRGAVPA